MSKSNSTTPKSRSETIHPPPGYCYVEESIARSFEPNAQHLSFLRTSTFSSFINVSGNDLDFSIQNFAKESSISVHNVFNGGPSPLCRSISLFEHFVESTIKLILQLSATSPIVLIIGSSVQCIDCILVACLRRVQEWSLVSVIGELRMYSGCRQLDVEQFIEAFDPDIVDISLHTLNYLQIHMKLKEEEEKLLNRLQQHHLQQQQLLEKQQQEQQQQQEQLSNFTNNNTNNTTNYTTNTPQNDLNIPIKSIVSESDVILGKLFFSNKLTPLSPGLIYDPNLSLINDKDDDD